MQLSAIELLRLKVAAIGILNVISVEAHIYATIEMLGDADGDAWKHDSVITERFKEMGSWLVVYGSTWDGQVVGGRTTEEDALEMALGCSKFLKNQRAVEEKEEKSKETKEFDKTKEEKE